MSDNDQDVRTKVSREEHAVLVAVSQSRGVEISEIVRQLIVRFVNERIHEARLVCANVPADREGTAATRRAAQGRSGSFCMGDPLDQTPEGTP